MGVKISSLPANSLPYTGAEKIPLVQGGITRAGTLSSFVSYLSGALLSDSELNGLSGNWQNTYTTFRANSADYALTNDNNTFSSTQIFTDGIQVGANTLFNQAGGNTGSFALGAGAGVDAGAASTNFENNILIGLNAGNATGGAFGNALSIISIGDNAGVEVGFGLKGSASNVINIGLNAGSQTGSANFSTPNETSEIISIGSRAGGYIGAGQFNSDGLAKHIISIGSDAGAYIGAATSTDITGGISNATDIVAIGQNAGSYAGSSRFSGASGNAVDIISIGKNAGSYAGSGNDHSPILGNATSIIAIGTDSAYLAGAAGADNAGSISNSIFIGLSSGYRSGKGDITNGVVNDLIAIGREAGFQSGYQTTSNNNIFIGLSSGYNKQGSRNTFIGDLTNTSPTSAVNLSGCIAIGYGATPTVRNTIAFGSASTPLSVVPGGTIGSSLSGLKIMINGRYFTIPLLP